MLSNRLNQYYGRLRHPPDSPPTSRPTPVIGQRTTTGPQPLGSGRVSPVPAVTIHTFHTPYAGEFLGADIQALHPFHGLHPEGRGSALPLRPPHSRQRSRRGRFRFMLRTAWLLPPMGLLTLRFDPTRFQTKPAVCYRAPWRLPGPDSHRQATTSMPTGVSDHAKTSHGFRAHSQSS